MKLPFRTLWNWSFWYLIHTHFPRIQANCFCICRSSTYTIEQLLLVLIVRCEPKSIPSVRFQRALEAYRTDAWRVHYLNNETNDVLAAGWANCLQSKLFKLLMQRLVRFIISTHFIITENMAHFSEMLFENCIRVDIFHRNQERTLVQTICRNCFFCIFTSSSDKKNNLLKINWTWVSSKEISHSFSKWVLVSKTRQILFLFGQKNCLSFYLMQKKVCFFYLM